MPGSSFTTLPFHIECNRFFFSMAVIYYTIELNDFPRIVARPFLLIGLLLLTLVFTHTKLTHTPLCVNQNKNVVVVFEFHNLCQWPDKKKSADN